jgi:DNA-binding XRE family transcriptional regulator
MIKEFRKKHGLTQRQMAKVLGLTERSIEYFEPLDNKGKLKDTKKVLELKAAMIRYDVESMKVKVYNDNSVKIADYINNPPLYFDDCEYEDIFEDKTVINLNISKIIFVIILVIIFVVLW